MVLVCLDDSPAKARWLTPEEKAIIANDLRVEAAGSSRAAGLSGVLSGIVACSRSSPSARRSDNMASPSGCRRSSRRAGVKGPLAIGLFSAIPFGVAIVCMLLTARSSDRRNERRWHLVVPFLIGAFGLAASTLFAGDVTASLIALCVAAAAATP